MRHNISPRGILEKDNKILFVEYQDSKGVLYALPGGSQTAGEDLKSALIREFKEETNLDIKPHEIVLVREFIIENPELEVWKNGIHQVEIIFRCEQTDPDQEASIGPLQDIGMLGIRWIARDDIHKFRVYPSRDLIAYLGNNSVPYLFDRE